MRYLLTLLFFLILLSAQSQTVIYEDQFANQVLSMGTAPIGYSISLGDSTLLIHGNGTASEWTAMTYQTHNGENSPILVDVSASPKLYIRVRGENQPNFRIDLQDESGYVTNLTPVERNLSENYKVYEFDYTNSLEDGGYGGPCTDAPCPVDASNIQGLILFVNAPDGGYTGTVEIDWISLGAPLVTSSMTPHEIRYNQVSYLIDRQKLISIVADSPFIDLPYSIYKENDNSPIFEGSTSSGTVWLPSDEFVGTVDLSSINEIGKYRFETPDESINFTVSSDGYNDLCEASLKYYYYNRASQALTAEYAGDWERPLGHPDDQVIVHASASSPDRPTGTIISSSKGWYDAGDYNKYIVNSGISTYTLLAAFEHYPEYYKNLTIDIPEQGGDLPDLLDEIAWNLDWMMTMQDPFDAGVYHKLTGLNFSGIIMPHQYNMSRYVVQKTTAATLNFAAVTAVASRIFADYESVRPGYSQELLAASEAAYQWAKANPTIYYNQPSDVNTGEYGDGNVTDEFDWAATELFITTGNLAYRQDINEAQIGSGVPAWPYTAPLALISLAHHADLVKNELNMDIIENRILATANQLRASTNLSPMRVAMGSGNGDFVWGSNGQAGNQIMMLIRAYEFSGDQNYLEAAYVAMDYLLGRNGTGFCYISGFGDKSPKRPHHRASEADNVANPIPGMVAGGPNPGQQDNCSGYIGHEPAASYVDSWCSYASNEVTINWNAPLAYSINALRFYQDKLPTSTVDYQAAEVTSLTILPNPGKNTVYLPQLTGSTNQRLQIINLEGQVLYELEVNHSQLVDVADLLPGIYVFRLWNEGRLSMSKWIKAE